MSSNLLNEDHLNDDPSASLARRVQQVFVCCIRSLCFCRRTPEINLPLANKSSIHSLNYLSVARFEDTDDGETAQRNGCQREVSQRMTNTDPLITHGEESPHCSFASTLKLTQPTSTSSPSSSATVVRHLSIPAEDDNPSQHRDAIVNMVNPLNTLFEVNSLQEVRSRTFSHWPYRTSPSSEQMIDAGFFGCNIDDRVICIYCNIICHVWTPHIDNPCEVHKTLSPDCIYVKSKLTRRVLPSIINANESSTDALTGNHSSTTNNLDPLRSSEIVCAVVPNPAYIEIPKRCASFATWPHENLARINDLVRSGFFYTGADTIVTCFYCNGSLQNWGPNDNPLIQHVLWFPHCAYVKQLCGDHLYRQIQEYKRAQQLRARANELKGNASAGIPSDTNITTNIEQLHIPDKNTLSRLVAARLDLPISKSLLNQNFKLSIIKRCWEDQLRLKQDDFATDDDLRIACSILQKQIEHIDGKKENIIIPSIKMRQIREQAEKEEKEILTQGKTAKVLTLLNATQSKSSNASHNTGIEIITSNENNEEPKTINPVIAITNDQDQSDNPVPSNPCVLCLTEEKRLACIPCGHLAACVPCGHSLRSCPICRCEIEAFIRIYT